MVKKAAALLLLLLSVCFVSIGAISAEENDASGGQNEKYEYKSPKLIDKEKLNELKKEGYSKKDIFMGALIAKETNKTVEEVLKIFTENQSWQITAEKLGVDKDDYERIEEILKWKEFVRENKSFVIEYLADYAGKETTDIHAYMKDNIPLHFLIGAAALAKLRDVDLDEIVRDKMNGMSFHEIMNKQEVGYEELKKEMENFRAEAMKKGKKLKKN